MTGTTKTRKLQARYPTWSERNSWYWLVCADKNLDASAKVLASRIGLYHFNSGTGRCDPSSATLAEGIGRSLRAIDPALKALRDAGWISWTKTKGYSNQYVLERVPYEGTTGLAEPAGMQPTTDPSEGGPLSSTTEGGMQSTTEGGMQSTAQEHVIEHVIEPVSPPQPPKGATKGKGASGGTRKKPTRGTQRPSTGSPFPANLDLDEHGARIASDIGVGIASQPELFASFRDHARHTGRHSNDWGAAWSLWCRNHVAKRTADEAREQPKVNKRLNPWG